MTIPHTLRFLLPSLLFLLLNGCDTSSSQGTIVNGIVSSGSPIVGVKVVAIDGHGNQVESAPTQKGGSYSLTLTGKGPYVLIAAANDLDGTPTLLSSVVAPDEEKVSTLQANLTPLTSLITSRLIKSIIHTPPAASTVAHADITPQHIANATHDITHFLQPIYTALAIPEHEVSDPIGSTTYQAHFKDPLERLFTVMRFMVRTNQITMGTNSDRITLTIPTAGSLPTVPPKTVASLARLYASSTQTPIKHVIVVIGENQTFDTLFATYQPAADQTIKNLLSQGIIQVDGSMGPAFYKAQQNRLQPQPHYAINLPRTTPYSTLLQPLQTRELQPNLHFLGGTPDPHFPADLPNGPFQLTKYLPYATSGPSFANPFGLTTADPVHRFFQMWQQTGGTNEYWDSYLWVAATAGMGGDNQDIIVTPANPAQGGELMAFYNMSMGDLPYLSSLANNYALSDNYHQSILGGTGANFFAIATADVPYYVNHSGQLATPPLNQIENPNPLPGTENFYQQDGYQGGSYVACGSREAPGVSPILEILSRLNVPSNCEPDTYYLVNNYGLGYDMNGIPQPFGPSAPYNYTLPPQTIRTIAEALADNHISWKWYTAGRDIADILPDAQKFHLPPSYVQMLQYNNIGDPLVASKHIMENPTMRKGLAGLTTFYQDVAQNNLPAVSFVVPTNLASGHPGFSLQQSYESFLQAVIRAVQANRSLWNETAIIVTNDEGGGYFDTGPIQVQDFFGDGPRVPMLVISPYARKQFVDHTYYDHASLLKFIERNWRLSPLTTRSRDNHPNPVTTMSDDYRPINTLPTLGDLMPMFDF